MKKILITGSAGGIGTAFRAFAKDRYSFVCFDRVPTPGVDGAVVADLQDAQALARAAEGCDAVVHLGGFRQDAPFHKVILPSNIIGTFNAFEAARLAFIKRFVFASTMQVDDGYEWGKMVSPTMPRRPMNLYAVSKGLGEDMGRTFASRYNMAVVALRLGWVALDSDPDWVNRSRRRPSPITLTGRDCCEIIAHSLEAEGITFAALHAFSQDGADFRDLDLLAQTIGYAPQDHAGKMFDEGKLTERVS